mgnify:CR=1 FL=1
MRRIHFFSPVYSFLDTPQEGDVFVLQQQDAGK